RLRRRRGGILPDEEGEAQLRDPLPSESRGYRRGAHVAGRQEGRPAGFRPLETIEGGRAVVAERLGTRAARVARRVQRHGVQVPRRAPRYPWGRPRPDVPPPRERSDDLRGGLGRRLVANLDAQRVRSEEHTSELQSLAYLVC